MNRGDRRLVSLALDVLNSRRFWLVLGMANLSAAVLIALGPSHSPDVRTVANWCRHWLLDGVSPYPGAEFRTNYPPYALVLLSPLAVVPQRFLELTWALVSAALAVIVGWLGLKSTPVQSRGGQPLLISVGFFLAWESLRVGIGLGQFTLVAVASGLAAVLYRGTIGRGILLGIAMIKPQVGVAFVLWAMLDGAWAAGVIAAVPIVLGTIVFAARLGQSPLNIAAAYGEVLRHEVGGTGFRQGSIELRPLFHDLIGQGRMADVVHVVFAAAALVIVVLALRRMSSVNRALFLLPLTCLWTLMSVYHPAYDLVLLWPASVALSNWQARVRPRTLVVAALSAVQLALVVDIPGLWWKLNGRVASPVHAGIVAAGFQHFDRFLVLGLFAALITVSIRPHPPTVTAFTSRSFSEDGLTPHVPC